MELDEELKKMPEILTANDIANHLQLTPCTVYVFMRKSPEVGGIPSYRFGRSVRAKKDEYITWFVSQKARFVPRKG